LLVPVAFSRKKKRFLSGDRRGARARRSRVITETPTATPHAKYPHARAFVVQQPNNRKPIEKL